MSIGWGLVVFLIFVNSSLACPYVYARIIGLPCELKNLFGSFIASIEDVSTKFNPSASYDLIFIAWTISFLLINESKAATASES
jgi:hypothetical protein